MPGLPNSQVYPDRHTLMALLCQFGLTAAVVVVLWRSRCLAHELLRISVELVFALGTAEGIRLTSVLGLCSGTSRFDIHAAHRVFHDSCVFHFISPLPLGSYWAGE